MHFFLDLVWITLIEQDFFDDFPEVTCEYTVSHTNSDKRPLLSISGKDSFGRSFIILRAFLPNERACVFRCIFLIVLPILFPQEFIQIDIAIEICFKST